MLGTQEGKFLSELLNWIDRGSMSVFRYNRSEYPVVFNEAVAVAENLLTSDDSICELCNPIASQFLISTAPSTRKITEPAELVTAVKAALNGGIYVFKVTEEKSVVRSSSVTNTIFVNEQYLTLPVSASEVNRKRCKVLLAVKVLHAVFHALTRVFWELVGYPPERNEDGTIAAVLSTPSHLGSVFRAGRTIVGNTGYAFEEKHFSGRLLCCPTDGYLSQLQILVRARVLCQSKLYTVPDNRVFEVLHAPESGRLKRTDLSLYYPSFQLVEAADLKDAQYAALLHSEALDEAPAAVTGDKRSRQGSGGMRRAPAWEDSSEGEDACSEAGEAVRRLTRAIFTGGAKN
jgi:hypothetical protein